MRRWSRGGTRGRGARAHGTGPRRRTCVRQPEGARPGDPPARRVGTTLLVAGCGGSPVLGACLSDAVASGPAPPGRRVGRPGAFATTTPRPVGRCSGAGESTHPRTPDPPRPGVGAVSARTEAAFSALIGLDPLRGTPWVEQAASPAYVADPTGTDTDTDTEVCVARIIATPRPRPRPRPNASTEPPARRSPQWTERAHRRRARYGVIGLVASAAVA